MALIPRDFIDNLLSRTDIVDIITQYVPLKKAGQNFTACCPFHHEKTPSFNVSPSKQIYKCFGCGVHGNVISFIMAYEHLTFPEAIEVLAKQQGLTVPTQGQTPQYSVEQQDLHQILEQCKHYFQQQLRQHPAAKQVISYLKQRGISGTTAQRFQLGFAPQGWDNLQQHLSATQSIKKSLLTTGMLIKNEQQRIYDRFRNRIMFPIRNRSGKVIAFGGRSIGTEQPKYLNSPETPIFHKAQELYGLYEARKASALTQVLIVEGYMDVLMLAQFGLTQVVATLGTAVSSQHIQTLFRYSNKLTFCFDGDSAGYKAAWRALQQSLTELHEGCSVNFMFLPEGEDPDSYIQRVGLDNFQQAMQQATDLPAFLLEHLSQNTNPYALDQQAEFIQHAIPLINKIPNSVLQQILVEQLAQRTKISMVQLQRWIRTPQKTIKQTIKQSPIALSPVRTAIAILLQHPEFAITLATQANLANWITQTTALEDMSLLVDIYQSCLNHKNITTANLVEQWRDHKAFELITHLAGQSFPETEGLYQQLIDALQHHQQQAHNKQIKQLLTAGRQRMLTAEEKIKLQDLIKAGKNLGIVR